MKKIVILLLIVLCISQISIASAAPSQHISVILNGKEVEFSPGAFIRTGKTMVPFRQLFEAYNVNVEWIAESQTIIATKDETKIKLTLDSLDAFVNDKKIRLNQTPFNLNATTYVGLRFISEVLGASVDFKKNPYVITINWTSESPHKSNGTLNPMNEPNEVRNFLDEHHIVNGDIYIKDGKVYINIVGMNDDIRRLLADRYKAGSYQTVEVAHSIQELQEAQQKLIDLKLFDKLNLYSSELDTINNKIVIMMPDTNEEQAKLEIQQYINPDLLSFVFQQESVNPKFVGYVTRIENQKALVVNPISRTINETRKEFYDAIWVSNIPPNIEVGQNVQVWFKGVIETSYPGQGMASKVTISEIQKPVIAKLTQDEVIRKALMNKDIANINILVIKEVSYDEKSAMWTIRYKSAEITDGVLEEYTIQIPDK